MDSLQCGEGGAEETKKRDLQFTETLQLLNHAQSCTDERQNLGDTEEHEHDRGAGDM